MTQENHCYENAKAERLSGILKQECGLDGCLASKREALGYATPMAVHVAA